MIKSKKPIRENRLFYWICIMADSLFYIFLGLVNVLMYFGKVNLIKDSKVNDLIVGPKMKVIFLICGILLIVFGVVLMGINIYEVYLME